MLLRGFYNLVWYLFIPLRLLRMTQRSLALPDYRRRWAERFGWIAKQDGVAPIWLHAVSVGEFNAALPLLRGWLEKGEGPPVLVTTTTPTGSQRVLAEFASELAEGRLRHVYLPFDLPGAVRRFFAQTQPRLGIIMETEVWPNLFRAARLAGVPLMLANARLSDKSARGYARIPRPFLQETLTAVIQVAAQSERDAQRWIELGMSADQVKALGNIKFDQQPPAELIERGRALRTQLGVSRPVWIAASTHAGEEMAALDAHARVIEENPNALLILVPRHPDRFADVAQLLRQRGFNAVARSSGEEVSADTSVFLGDSLGEMMLFYAASDIAFVAGSLADIGGHNFIEPASLGLPLVSGPRLHNFRQIADWLKADEALCIVENADELAAQLADWMANVDNARAAGQRALRVAEANRGALERLQSLIDTLL